MQTKYLQSNAEVWSQPNCTYCTQAKALLAKAGIQYKEYVIGIDGYSKKDLIDRVPNARTVPQIFLDGQYVGGFTELRKLLADDNN